MAHDRRQAVASGKGPCTASQPPVPPWRQKSARSLRLLGEREGSRRPRESATAGRRGQACRRLWSELIAIAYLCKFSSAAACLASAAQRVGSPGSEPGSSGFGVVPVTRPVWLLQSVPSERACILPPQHSVALPLSRRSPQRCRHECCCTSACCMLFIVKLGEHTYRGARVAYFVMPRGTAGCMQPGACARAAHDAALRMAYTAYQLLAAELAAVTGGGNAINAPACCI